MTTNSNILGLDVGSKRIGVAIASREARLPRALPTLERTENTLQEILELLEREKVGTVVVGLPRNLDSADTQQTIAVRAFADELRQKTTATIKFQDEALTSKAAEDELVKRGKPYAKGDIDALAATIILSDFIGEHVGVEA